MMSLGLLSLEVDDPEQLKGGHMFTQCTEPDCELDAENPDCLLRKRRRRVSREPWHKGAAGLRCFYHNHKEDHPEWICTVPECHQQKNRSKLNEFCLEHKYFVFDYVVVVEKDNQIVSIDSVFAKEADAMEYIHLLHLSQPELTLRITKMMVK